MIIDALSEETAASAKRFAATSKARLRLQEADDRLVSDHPRRCDS
jgi:hypothetical protein